MRAINIRNFTHFIVKVFTGFDTLFWPIFVDFRNGTAGLCINNSVDKDMK